MSGGAPEFKTEEFCTRCGRALPAEAEEYTGTGNDLWMETRSGIRFHLLDPQIGEINDLDISYGLSFLCRFTGHVREFYSVAQHCVLVSQIVPTEDALAGLLHDGAEAYVGDVNRPLKRALAGFKKIEEAIQRVIFAAHGLPPHIPESVKRADVALVLAEKRDLMGAVKWQEFQDVAADPRRIDPWSPTWARERFEERLRELTR